MTPGVIRPYISPHAVQPCRLGPLNGQLPVISRTVFARAHFERALQLVIVAKKKEPTRRKQEGVLQLRTNDVTIPCRRSKLSLTTKVEARFILWRCATLNLSTIQTSRGYNVRTPAKLLSPVNGDIMNYLPSQVMNKIFVVIKQ